MLRPAQLDPVPSRLELADDTTFLVDFRDTVALVDALHDNRLPSWELSEPFIALLRFLELPKRMCEDVFAVGGLDQHGRLLGSSFRPT